MKKVFPYLCTGFIAIIILAALQRLVVPKYMEGTIEGAMVAEYYKEVKDHDVILIGDCEVYENISPAVLWRDFGFNAYIRGSAQQTMWQSYYLLRETLRYETPDVVVLSVFAMQYDTSQNEAYNRMTLDNMRWSWDKVDAIRASMTKDETFLSYVFPGLRFHERWKALKTQDFRYYFHKKNVTHNGYYLRTERVPVTVLPTPAALTEESFGDNAAYYLDRIVRLCKERDIPLLLIKAPSLWPHWYDAWEEQIVTYADAHDLRYINLLSLSDDIGLDFTTDTYDGGLHLNVYGAEKCAAYLGEVLHNEYHLADRRKERALAARWEEKLKAYEDAKASGTETAP